MVDFPTLDSSDAIQGWYYDVQYSIHDQPLPYTFHRKPIHAFWYRVQRHTCRIYAGSVKKKDWVIELVSLKLNSLKCFQGAAELTRIVPYVPADRILWYGWPGVCSTQWTIDPTGRAPRGKRSPSFARTLFWNKILKFTIPQYINKRKEIKMNPVPGLRGINLDVLIKSPTFKFSVAII